MKISIRTKHTSPQILFEIEMPDAVPEHQRIRMAAEAACAQKVSLANAELLDVDLSGAKLAGVDLRDAVLARSNLEAADLRDADLTGADLNRTRLHDAEFAGANMRGTSFLHAVGVGEANLEPVLTDLGKSLDAMPRDKVKFLDAAFRRHAELTEELRIESLHIEGLSPDRALLRHAELTEGGRTVLDPDGLKNVMSYIQAKIYPKIGRADYDPETGPAARFFEAIVASNYVGVDYCRLGVRGTSRWLAENGSNIQVATTAADDGGAAAVDAERGRDYLYPCILVRDSYDGEFSRGKWTAWNMVPSLIDRAICGDGMDDQDDCKRAWQSMREIEGYPVGLGETAHTAYNNLTAILRQNRDSPSREPSYREEIGRSLENVKELEAAPETEAEFITSDRYNGLYSGGKWIAWDRSLYLDEISTMPFDVPVICRDFWATWEPVAGRGATPFQADQDLTRRTR